MPKKESGAQGRKRRAQFEAFLNESRKFMKNILKVVDMQKENSADIQRPDESAETDNQRIVKHRGRKIFVCPGAQDTLATPLQLTKSNIKNKITSLYRHLGVLKLITKKKQCPFRSTGRKS